MAKTSSRPRNRFRKSEIFLLWCGNSTSGSGREVWDRDGLWDGFFGGRLINPEHRTEMRILFTKPSAFLLHCFQALLNIVLIRHAAVHYYELRGRSYPRNEAIKQPILCPMDIRSPQWNDPLNWHSRDGHTLRERKHQWREGSDIPGNSSARP